MASTKNPEEFWRGYEAQHGEKVLAHSLGCYMTGWDDYQGPLWGLLIATDGGFRFHHFPHEGWIKALSRVSGGGGDEPVEKTLFIPRDRLASIELSTENSWLRRIVFARPPQFVVGYLKGDGSAGTFLADSDKSALPVVAALRTLLS
jgi:hypothetical protein